MVVESYPINMRIKFLFKICNIRYFLNILRKYLNVTWKIVHLLTIKYYSISNIYVY